MEFLQSLAFILGTGWDKKAREAIQKIELLSPSLHLVFQRTELYWATKAASIGSIRHFGGAVKFLNNWWCQVSQ